MLEFSTELVSQELVLGELKQLEHKFSHIAVGNRTINCPFWMNYDSLYSGTPNYRAVPRGGKLTPEEVEIRINQEAAAGKVDLDQLSLEQLKDFILTAGIGVDCSGMVHQFLSRAYSALGKNDFDRRITNQDSAGGITKIGVSELQLPHNSREITDLAVVRPSDFITIGNTHVIVVLENLGSSLNCYHTSNETPASGAHSFNIQITHPSGPITAQHWEESTHKGQPYDTLVNKGMKVAVRRLHILD